MSATNQHDREKRERSLARQQAFFLGLTMVGIGMIGFSFVLPHWITANTVWSESEATDLGAFSVELHHRLHEFEHEHEHHEHDEDHEDEDDHEDGFHVDHDHEGAMDDPEVAAAARRYAASQTKLQRAIALKERWPGILQLLGAVLGIVGGMGWFALRG